MKHFLWDNKALKDACPAAELYGTCCGNRICIDSKRVEEGDIFLALKGENTDGHEYVLDAFKNGATCAIVESLPLTPKDHDRLMLVAEARAALKQLAVFNRQRSKAKIIAVTGSVGKTSTKEALQLACSANGSSYCSWGNFNNALGLPISIASMPIDSKFGIFELGMNHPGEIKQLTKLLRPHLALITTVSKVHFEHFNSLKDIALAKGEIFSGMDKNGIAILNGDDKYYSLLSRLALEQGIVNVCSFGESFKNESHLLKYEDSKIKARIFNKEIEYEIQANGKHQAINSIAALAAISKLGIGLKAAAKALSAFSSGEGRGAISELRLKKKVILIIDDSYNASPISVKAALQVLQNISGSKRKIAVLGDMRELGPCAKREHQELAETFEASGINKLVTVGPLMKNLFNFVVEAKGLKHFNDYNDAKHGILRLIEDGDCILFKGSNGTKVHEIVKYLKEQAL